MKKSSKDANAAALYRKYRSNAASRGVPFKLTKEWFLTLVEQECIYCGRKPRQLYHHDKRSKNRPFKYNGIDRLDNRRGYTKKNSVPCCKFCNYAKGTNTITQFLSWVYTIYQHSLDAPVLAARGVKNDE